MRKDLEATNPGKWVLLQGGRVVSYFDSREDATRAIVPGDGPPLILQVGTSM